MTMASAPVDLLQGTLDVLVLKSLSWGPRHGHAVARMIRDTTAGTLDVTDGSLYVALHRLEERGLVESEWGLSDKGKRARFYKLTTTGRQQLKAETATWRRYVESVARMLNATTAPA
jgi:PadR family transcriptional regulator, regulatory protein PadR